MSCGFRAVNASVRLSERGGQNAKLWRQVGGSFAPSRESYRWNNMNRRFRANKRVLFVGGWWWRRNNVKKKKKNKTNSTLSYQMFAGGNFALQNSYGILGLDEHRTGVRDGVSLYCVAHVQDRRLATALHSLNVSYSADTTSPSRLPNFPPSKQTQNTMIIRVSALDSSPEKRRTNGAWFRRLVYL